MVELAARELGRSAARDIEDEKMAPTVVPADAIEAGSETAHDSGGVTRRHRGVLPVGRTDFGDHGEACGVRRPGRLAD